MDKTDDFKADILKREHTHTYTHTKEDKSKIRNSNKVLMEFK
jgi:hypothetical protein